MPIKASEVTYDEAINYFDKHLPKMERYAELCSSKGAITNYIDVGANAGVFAALIAKQNPSIKNILLIEPFQNLASIALRNVNSVIGPNTQVKAVVCGASDVVGNAKIKVWEGNYGASTMVVEAAPSEFETIYVPTQRLDDIVLRESINKIDLIKIDVEGFEHAVLRGMPLILKEHRPLIFLEVGWGHEKHPRWNSDLDAFRMVEDWGYMFCDQKFRPYDYRKVNCTSDWFFVPVEKME